PIRNISDESVARDRAEKIVIPEFELKDASLFHALELLRQKAVEADPQKIGVKIVLMPSRARFVQMTLSLKDAPVIELLRYITDLGNAELIVTPDALEVQPKDGGLGAKMEELKKKVLELSTERSDLGARVAALQQRVRELDSKSPAHPIPGDPSDLFLDAFL